jgi:hypothetical protein
LSAHGTGTEDKASDRNLLKLVRARHWYRSSRTEDKASYR